MKKFSRLLPFAMLGLFLGLAPLALAQPSGDAPAAAEVAPAAEDAPTAPLTPAPTAAPTTPAAAPAGSPAGSAPVATPSDPGDFASLLGSIGKAVTSGNYALAAVLALVLLTAGIRLLSNKIGALGVFSGRWAGWGLLFVGSTAGMLATTLGAGGSLSFRLVSQAAIFGLAASGFWELLKDVKKKPVSEA